MKRSLCIALLVMANYLSANCPQPLRSSFGIKDGWYVATVQYTNYATYTNATYSLNVYVEYNKVSTIDFGNGGSVHDGYNNEGYTYSGGYLNYQYQYGTMNIISATTSVTVYDKNGTRSYRITIE